MPIQQSCIDRFDCLGCKRAVRHHQQQRQHSNSDNVPRNLAKSSSLQENPLDPLSCRAPTSSLSFALDSPTCSTPATTRQFPLSNRFHVPLQRQHSTLQYSSVQVNRSFKRPSDPCEGCNQPPDWAPAQMINDTRDVTNQSTSRPDNNHLDQDETAPAAHESQEATTVTSHCLAGLAGWILVPWQPMVGACIGSQQQQRQDSNAFSPAIRFCLMILLMNFLLRLTDNLSSVLVDLLTIAGAQPHTSSVSQLRPDRVEQ